MNFKALLFCISYLPKFLAATGLVLQVVALYSNSWVILHLMLVPNCEDVTPTPTMYDDECRQWHYDPQEVGRAGLWKVCHSFPLGFIPKMYFYTEPYCANFSEDERPEEWLEIPQFLCQLAIALNVVGVLLSLMADLTKHSKGNWASSAILIISATCGFLGAVIFYINISKDFLMPYKLDTISMFPHWGFYCSIDGSVTTLLGALLQKRKKP